MVSFARINPTPLTTYDRLGRRAARLIYIDAPVLRWRDADVNPATGLEETLYYASDANMNVTALVDASSGNVVERYVYTPYGEATFMDADWIETEVGGFEDGTASTVDNEILFTGHPLDFETRLYLARFRYDHPTLGRWTGPDPIGYAVTMNLYEYVSSRPISYIDTDGRFLIGCSRAPKAVPPENPIGFSSQPQSQLLKIDSGRPPEAVNPELPCGAARHIVWFEMLVNANGALIQHVKFERFQYEDCNGKNLLNGQNTLEWWESAEVHMGNIHGGRAGLVGWLFDFVRAKPLTQVDKFETQGGGDCTRGHIRLTGTSKFVPQYEISSQRWANSGTFSPTMPTREDQPPGWDDDGGLVHIMDVKWDCCSKPRTMTIQTQPAGRVTVTK